MFLDLLVEQRLRIAWIVGFVVAPAAVAEHVDHDIFLELQPVIERHLRHANGGFGIVAVDVENRRLHHARYVSRIRRRARFVGLGGEADLVIDD